MVAFALCGLGGNVDKVKKLIEDGANVHDQASNGENPFHIAEFAGKAAIAEILMKAEADMHSQDENGRTPHYL